MNTKKHVCVKLQLPIASLLDSEFNAYPEYSYFDDQEYSYFSVALIKKTFNIGLSFHITVMISLRYFEAIFSIIQNCYIIAHRNVLVGPHDPILHTSLVVRILLI